MNYLMNSRRHDTENILKFNCYLKKAGYYKDYSPKRKFILNKYFISDKLPDNTRNSCHESDFLHGKSSDVFLFCRF